MFANYNARQTNVAKKTIKIMMNELSQTWKTFLKKQRYNVQLFIARKKFYVKQKKKSNKFVSLIKYNYIKNYKFMIKQKIENIDFFDKIKKLIETYHRATCVKFSKKKVWHTTKLQFDLIKIENLLWKLLHQKLKIEVNWHWLKEIKRMCSIHEQIFTIYYIFFECFVVDAMWQKIKNVWIYLCLEKIKIFQNVSKLIVYMTFCSLKTTSLNKRKWNIVFRTTIWIIWKIYLFHSF